MPLGVNFEYENIWMSMKNMRHRVIKLDYFVGGKKLVVKECIVLV